MDFSAEAPETSAQNSNQKILLIGVMVLVAVTALAQVRFVLFSELDADEVEHAHITWLLSQGVKPYADIHQIHMPTLWIINAPWFGLMPESSKSVLLLRGTCLLAILGSCLAGFAMIKQLRGVVAPLEKWLFLLLFLGYVGVVEIYRFRPDPFMTCCVAWAIVFMQRLDAAPVRNAWVSGILLGLGASFTPKMVPFCLLLAILMVHRAWREKNVWCLRLPFYQGFGFLAALVPMILWLWWQGLLEAFYIWTILNNTHTLNMPADWCMFRHDAVPLSFLAILGVPFLLSDYLEQDAVRFPALVIAAAVLLGISVRVIEPNHAMYNFQCLSVPGAVVVTLFLIKLLKLFRRSQLGYSLLFLILFSCLYLYQPVVREGLQLQVAGGTIHRWGMDDLIDATRNKNATCVGLAPVHPVFCRDATELYLAWDFFFLSRDWITASGKEPYKNMWKEAVDLILEKKPDLIVQPEFFELAAEQGVIDQDDYERFHQMLHENYQLFTTKNSYRFSVRNDVADSPEFDKQNKRTASW